MSAHTRCFFAAVTLAWTFPASSQSGPPAPSTLEDISGCSVDGDNVFVSTGRDSTARRYRYPFDAAIDGLCNAKGFAIVAPPKAPPPAAAARTSSTPVVAKVAPSTAEGSNRADFPPTVTTPNAQELAAHVASKSFRTTFADGTPVRTKFGPDGGLSINAPSYYDSGRWKAEDGRICGSLRKTGEFCNDARLGGSSLYLRRTNGEIVRHDPD